MSTESNAADLNDAETYYNKAIADLTQAIRIDPNDALAYNSRGVVYHKKEEYDKAIADYTEAIRIDPNDALAYNNRGLAYRKKGEADFAKAVKFQYEELNSLTQDIADELTSAITTE